MQKNKTSSGFYFFAYIIGLAQFFTVLLICYAVVLLALFWFGVIFHNFAHLLRRRLTCSIVGLAQFFTVLLICYAVVLLALLSVWRSFSRFYSFVTPSSCLLYFSMA